MCSTDKKSFAKGAALGAALGAVLGILFAPKSGKETRQQIKDTSKDYYEKGKKTAEGAKDKVIHTVEDIKGKVEKSELVEAVEETVEDIENTAKAAKRRFFKGTSGKDSDEENI